MRRIERGVVLWRSPGVQRLAGSVYFEALPGNGMHEIKIAAVCCPGGRASRYSLPAGRWERGERGERITRGWSRWERGENFSLTTAYQKSIFEKK